MQALLADHIPLHPAPHRTEPVTVDRQLAPTTLGALRSLTAMAECNAQVLTNLAATRQLYIDGARLTGDEVTNHNQLVAAKLHARPVRLTPDRLVAVRDAYRSLANAERVTRLTPDALNAVIVAGGAEAIG